MLGVVGLFDFYTTACGIYLAGAVLKLKGVQAVEHFAFLVQHDKNDCLGEQSPECSKQVKVCPILKIAEPL